MGQNYRFTVVHLDGIAGRVDTFDYSRPGRVVVRLVKHDDILPLQVRHTPTTPAESQRRLVVHGGGLGDEAPELLETAVEFLHLLDVIVHQLVVVVGRVEARMGSLQGHPAATNRLKGPHQGPLCLRVCLDAEDSFLEFVVLLIVEPRPDERLVSRVRQRVEHLFRGLRVSLRSGSDGRGVDRGALLDPAGAAADEGLTRVPGPQHCLGHFHVRGHDVSVCLCESLRQSGLRFDLFGLDNHLPHNILGMQVGRAGHHLPRRVVTVVIRKSVSRQRHQVPLEQLFCVHHVLVGDPRSVEAAPIDSGIHHLVHRHVARVVHERGQFAPDEIHHGRLSPPGELLQVVLLV